MAFATKVTIGTGNKVTQSYQSQDVSVSVSYDLERADTDLVAFMAEKAVEVEACHTAVWQGIYGIRAERAGAGGSEGAVAPNDTASAGPPYQQEQARRTRRSKEPEAPAPEQSKAAPEATEQAAVPEEPAKDTVQASSESPAEPPQEADIRLHEPATNLQKIVIRSLWTRAGHTPADMSQVVTNLYGKSTLDDLTRAKAAELTLALQKGEIGQPQAAAA
jgi:hypothetical protein